MIEEGAAEEETSKVHPSIKAAKKTVRINIFRTLETNQKLITTQGVLI